jgi:transcription-repair coupling factor (superfamily II helicase)
VPEGITDEAERRLRILEHFTDLGSGYAVALKDLELRGAGNILGSEQSGFVHAIGLDTYTRLLEENIRRLRDGVTEERAPAEVSLEGAAYLPDAYVADSAQKLHLYRRLSRLETTLELDALAREIRDRYGVLPTEVERLLTTAMLRLLGTSLGIERILVKGDAARITFAENAAPRLASLQGTFNDQQVEVEVRRTVPLSIVLRRRGARPITETVVAALERLIDDVAAAA